MLKHKQTKNKNNPGSAHTGGVGKYSETRWDRAKRGQQFYLWRVVTFSPTELEGEFEAISWGGWGGGCKVTQKEDGRNYFF